MLAGHTALSVWAFPGSLMGCSYSWAAGGGAAEQQGGPAGDLPGSVSPLCPCCPWHLISPSPVPGLSSPSSEGQGDVGTRQPGWQELTCVEHPGYGGDARGLLLITSSLGHRFCAHICDSKLWSCW